MIKFFTHGSALRSLASLEIRQWLYVLIPIGVLALCFLLPLRIESTNLGLLAAMIYGIGGLLILLRWPPLGLLIVVMMGLIAPSPYLPGGLNFTVLLLAALFGLWLLDMMVNKREYGLLKSPVVRPLLLLCFVAFLAFVNGQLPWFSMSQAAPLDAQIGGLLIFILALGAFLLTAYQIDDIRWLQWLVWTFLGLGAIFIAGWLVSDIGAITSQIFQRPTTSNSMFWVWLMALSFSQALFNRELALGWRVALGTLFVATFYVAFVIAYSWKGGWMPPMIAIAAIIAIRSWRIGIAMAVVGTMPALYLYSQAVATDEYSYSTRLDAWILILEMVKVNPLLGFGPANYYWYTPLFPIRGYEVQFNSHSQYLDIVAQTGILGLLCFLWFAWQIGWLGWQLRERVPEGFPRAYVYGVLGGWVGTLGAGILVDWFLPFVYNIGLSGFRASMLPWLFLGGLVSIERIYHREAT